jgi:molybdopterin-guanine dinucleotide biosynthesis protein A
MITNVTGVVLAGGKSSRMGQNKAMLVYDNKPLIETVVERLSGIFSKVVLSVNDPLAFPQLNLPHVADVYPNTGPLGAIASVLETGESRIFAVACDMPFLNPRLIQFLCSLETHDAVIPVWGEKPEALHAVYSAALLPTFQFWLNHGRYKIIDAIEESSVLYLLQQEIAKIDPDGQSFRNINTPADYELIK